MNARLVVLLRKLSLKIQKIFISGPITMKMLSQVRIGPRSLNLCLDLKQLDGKGVKKLIKHTNRHEMLGGSTIEKRILENLENLYFWSYQYENAQLGGLRSPNLYLDLKQLDGKGVKQLIKHTNQHEMLRQVDVGLRSPHLCLDLKQLDGKGVKKVIKHTNRHGCQVGGTIKKRVLENLENLYFLFYHYKKAQLGASWPKDSKSVLRFEIT